MNTSKIFKPYYSYSIRKRISPILHTEGITHTNILNNKVWKKLRNKVTFACGKKYNVGSTEVEVSYL